MTVSRKRQYNESLEIIQKKSNTLQHRGMVKMRKRLYDLASDQLTESEKNDKVAKYKKGQQEALAARTCEMHKNVIATKNKTIDTTQSKMTKHVPESLNHQPQSQAASYGGTSCDAPKFNAKGTDQRQLQEDLDHQSEPQTTSTNANSMNDSQVKIGRGAAKFPKEWNTGKKLHVFLDRKGSVAGDDYQKYATAIGCLARIGVKFPLSKITFNNMPQYQRDMVWDEVEDNTELPPQAKTVVMNTVADIWRKWKSYVKTRYFVPYKDDEKFLLQPPTDDRIQLDQWLEMVTYWKNDKVQDIAEQNSINVLKKQCLHRTGRSPFSTLEEEMLAKGMKTVARLDVWMESRNRGKGIQDDPMTLDLHGQFSRELSKKPVEEITKEYKDENFKIALGKGRHHVRCEGRGSTVNRSRGKTISIDEVMFSQDREELQKLKDDFGKQQDEMQQMKEKLLIEQEKTSLLNKKLELVLSQFPTISSTILQEAPQVHDVSNLHIPGSNSSQNAPINEQHQSSGLPYQDPSIEDEQIVFAGDAGQGFEDFHRIKVGAKVHIYCYGIPKKIVAEGIFYGYMDHNGDRPQYCQVGITKALVPNERLPKARHGIVNIGQAINHCIQWDLINVAVM